MGDAHEIAYFAEISPTLEGRGRGWVDFPCLGECFYFSDLELLA
jgi:hypothetical protein